MLYNFYLTQFSISAIIKKKIGRRPYTLNNNNNNNKVNNTQMKVWSVMQIVNSILIIVEVIDLYFNLFRDKSVEIC